MHALVGVREGLLYWTLKPRGFCVEAQAELAHSQPGMPHGSWHKCRTFCSRITTYLPHAMVCVSQYTDFHIAKSPLLGNTACGVSLGGWEPLQSLGKGWGGHRPRWPSASPGRCSGLRAEEKRDSEQLGCGAGGISCSNPGHVASRSPAVLPAAVGLSATSGTS